MDQFRTTFPIKESGRKISFNMGSLFMGSCFTEHIGFRMADLKFAADLNPFGILYNPASIRTALERLLQAKSMKASELIFFNDKWISLHHHGRFSHPDKDSCLKGINDRIRASVRFLKEAAYLFITFGTAWVFEWKETGEVVSNCHKIPSDKFQRRLLKPEEIIENYTLIIQQLQAMNPGLQIVFTVSPVRHWKDGAEGNQRSKSILHFAIHELIESSDRVSYFPAYELVMDDLRDYRFYAGDMFHINQVGIDYIWNRFEETYIDNEARKLIPGIARIKQAADHRLSDNITISRKKFAEIQLAKIKELTNAHPYLDFSPEEDYFKTLL